jgi:hypothetical protein
MSRSNPSSSKKVSLSKHSQHNLLQAQPPPTLLLPSGAAPLTLFFFLQAQPPSHSSSSLQVHLPSSIYCAEDGGGQLGGEMEACCLNGALRRRGRAWQRQRRAKLQAAPILLEVWAGAGGVGECWICHRDSPLPSPSPTAAGRAVTCWFHFVWNFNFDSYAPRLIQFVGVVQIQVRVFVNLLGCRFRFLICFSHVYLCN